MQSIHIRPARGWTTQARRDHDLRNNLGLIVSIAQLLQSGQAGPLTETQREFIGHLGTCVDEIRRLLALGDERHGGHAASPPDLQLAGGQDVAG